MAYVLDTNICIHNQKKPETVLKKFNDIKPDEIAISMITVAELEYGHVKALFLKRIFKLYSNF